MVRVAKRWLLQVLGECGYKLIPKHYNTHRHRSNAAWLRLFFSMHVKNCEGEGGGIR